MALDSAPARAEAPFDVLFNLRDFGGQASAHGGRVARGRLFRSAQHAGSSEADLARVAALGIGTVIDLRGRSERRAMPCPRAPGFAPAVISVEEETYDPAALAARKAHRLGDARSAAEAREAMLTAYDGMAFRPVLAGLYRRYFEALASADEPTLIHCYAGKDRTGIAVALVLHVLGVHRDDMLADYLATNTAPGRAAWVTRSADHARRTYGAMNDATLAVLFSVDEAFLARAFAAIEARHGSLDAYLAEALGVDAARADAIRARLLVS